MNSGIEWLEHPIDDLELSVRTINCLRNDNINTIGDLVRKDPGHLLHIRNFGRQALFEIKESLSRKGLHLGMTMQVEIHVKYMTIKKCLEAMLSALKSQQEIIQSVIKIIEMEFEEKKLDESLHKENP